MVQLSQAVQKEETRKKPHRIKAHGQHAQRAIFSFCQMKLTPGWSRCIAKRSPPFKLAGMLELKPVTHHGSEAGSF